MSWGARLGLAVWGALGVGCVVGGFEVAALAVRLPVPFVPIELLLAGAVAVAATGALGVLLALALSPALYALRARETEVAVAAVLALCTMGLAGLHIWRVSWLLWTESRSMAAFTLGILPIGLAGIVYYNAQYWVKRIAVGRSGVAAWPVLAALVSAAGVGAAVAIAVLRPAQGPKLAGNSAILVTVDGLRRDAVGVYGGDPTPYLDQLARESITFVDAVSPTPASGPGNAAALSGLHPLRSRRLTDADDLIRAVVTLPEALSDQGWTTAAFVGATSVAAETGMAQGFLSYDDRFVPPWARVALLAPFAAPTWRPARETTGAFLRWLGAQPSRPFFVWIHYADPAVAAASGGDVAAAVVQVDASIQQIREALEAADRWDDTAMVIAGTHGWMNGEHGLTGAVGLYDPMVRVPLVVRVPRYQPRVPRPEPQVRLMDIPATLLELLALEPVLESEGAALLGYGTGRRTATMSCTLVGRSSSGELRVGLRNNGVKFLEAPTGGTPELYVLGSDPREERNLAAEEPTIVEAARGLVGSDAAALRALEPR